MEVDKITSGHSGLSGFGVMKSGSYRNQILAFVASLVFAVGGVGAGQAFADQAGALSGPAELLAVGFEALETGRTSQARKTFENILSNYPQSTQAAAAAEALMDLDGGNSPGDSGDAADVGEADVMGEAPAPRPEERVAAPARASSVMDSPVDIATGKRLARAPGLLPSAEDVRRMRNRFLLDVGDRVFFAQNSAVLGGRARAIVEAQSHWLNKLPSLQIIIIGRAADGGNGSDDAELSLARARAVEAKLIESGVAPSRIRVEARGSSDPIATCQSPSCQAQNRHAESLVGFPGMGTSQLSGPAGAMAIDLPAARQPAAATAR